MESIDVPTVNGLGCPGDGDRAKPERIVLDRLAPQDDLLAAPIAES